MRPSSLLLVLLLSCPVVAGTQLEPPETDSPPVLRFLELRFPTQRNRPFHEPLNYLRQASITKHLNMPGRNEWVSYADAVPVILEDATHFWQTGKFKSLWVDVTDRPFNNGVPGILVIFNFVERTDMKVPAVDYPTPPEPFQQAPTNHRRLYPPPTE
ncbi:MAG TPA: hypothetical protein DIU48_10035 [Acidobacteria bacterium]|nr:hypothetical protein [Acidobacteriota bacterium]